MYACIYTLYNHVMFVNYYRGDVRGVALSGDGNTVATCSAESVKVWSSRTHLCLGTSRVDGYCLCVAFAPGGRYIIAGTKEGFVQVHTFIVI